MCGVAAWAESWVVVVVADREGRGGVRHEGCAEPTEILWIPTDSGEGAGEAHITTTARFMPFARFRESTLHTPHTIPENRPEAALARSPVDGLDLLDFHVLSLR
jgi:hypothetical protein